MLVSVDGTSVSLVAEVRAVLRAARGISISDDGAADLDIETVCLDTAGRKNLSGAGLLADSERPQRRVLVVGAVPSPYGMRVLIARLEGVVLGHSIEESLVPTLAAVAAGQNAFPQAFAGCLRHPSLSVREKQILGMVVLNASNSEIAQQLWITESAVKNHLTSAFSKLGVRSRAAATDLIVDPESGLGLGILRITSGQSPADPSATRS